MIVISIKVSLCLASLGSIGSLLKKKKKKLRRKLGTKATVCHGAEETLLTCSQSKEW